MPFGLKNATQAFQRLMDSVCQGMEFAFVYIDDILVASRDTESHTRLFCLLFQQLHEHGLVINVSKCKFGCSTLDFLGHHISSTGITPLPENVEPITNLNEPETIKGLQCFVGKVQFNRRFIPAATRIMTPLFEALTGKPKAMVWNAAIVKAFDDTEQSLTNATLLAHPHQNAPTSLTTDASGLAVGAVLQQYVDESRVP